VRGAAGGNAGSALGGRGAVRDGAALANAERALSRMARSRNFALFVLGGSAARQDARLAKSLSLVHDDKVRSVSVVLD
jgi:hypothetical protein